MRNGYRDHRIGESESEFSRKVRKERIGIDHRKGGFETRPLGFAQLNVLAPNKYYQYSRGGGIDGQEGLRTLIDSVRKSGRRALSAPEAQQLCDAYGIPTPKQALAKSAAEAAKIAARLRFPSSSKLSPTISCIRPKPAA